MRGDRGERYPAELHRKVAGQRDGEVERGGGGGAGNAARSFIRPFTPVAKATCLQGTGEMHNHGQNNSQGGRERERERRNNKHKVEEKKKKMRSSAGSSSLMGGGT